VSFLKKKAFSSRVTASRTTSGRPPNKERQNVADMIAGETDCGHTIIRFMVGVLEGKEEGCTPAAKVAAATFLAHYLWGKPMERSVQMSMTTSVEVLPGLSDEELENILRGGSQHIGELVEKTMTEVAPTLEAEVVSPEQKDEDKLLQQEDILHGGLSQGLRRGDLLDGRSVPSGLVESSVVSNGAVDLPEMLSEVLQPGPADSVPDADDVPEVGADRPESLPVSGDEPEGGGAL